MAETEPQKNKRILVDSLIKGPSWIKELSKVFGEPVDAVEPDKDDPAYVYKSSRDLEGAVFELTVSGKTERMMVFRYVEQSSAFKVFMSSTKEEGDVYFIDGTFTEGVTIIEFEMKTRKLNLFKHNADDQKIVIASYDIQ